MECEWLILIVFSFQVVTAEAKKTKHPKFPMDAYKRYSISNKYSGSVFFLIMEMTYADKVSNA